jgi:hypothetical protein
MDTQGNSPANADDESEKMRRAFELFMLTGKKKNQQYTEKTKDMSLPSVVVNSTMQQSASMKKKKIKNKNNRQLSVVGLKQIPPKSSSLSDRNGSLSSVETTAAVAAVNVLSTTTTANDVAISVPKAIHNNNNNNSSNNSSSSSSIKRYYQLLRTFSNKVQHTWFNIDDQIIPILHNICSIRSRLPLEWKVMQNYSSNNMVVVVSSSLTNNDNDDSWKNYGYRQKQPRQTRLGGAVQWYNNHNDASSSSSLQAALQIQDVQLAISNDITQHEKMITAIRKLMSELADCHNSLGRCLDNIWKFHCSTTTMVGMVVQQEMTMMGQAQEQVAGEYINSDDNDDEEGVVKCEEEKDGDCDRDNNNITNIVQLVTDVYHMLSNEIYRKQILILELIESSGGDESVLLGIVETHVGRKSSNNERLLNSQQIAQKICTVWSSKSANESYVDMNMITRLFDIAAKKERGG